MNKTKLEEEIYNLEKEKEFGEKLTKKEIREIVKKVEEYDPDLLRILTVKCISCGEYMYSIVEEYGVDAVAGYQQTDEGLLCQPCYEQEITEPPAIALIRNHDNGYGGFEDDEGNTRCIIGHYINETGGDFEVNWHSIDGWRGYYEVKGNGWKELHSDCILDYSNDERELENFDEELMEFLDNEGIGYARVFSKTSNVFSQGYDVFVREEDLERVEDAIKVLTMVNKLREKYRDPERFTLTALTGKDEFDESDELLVRGIKELGKGKDLEEIKGELLEAI